MDTALQCLAQVQDLGVAGQDLGKHNQNIPDVSVISGLQAVNWSLYGADTKDMIIPPSFMMSLSFKNNNNTEEELTLVSM